MNIIWTTLFLASLVCVLFTDPSQMLSATVAGGTTAVTTALSLCAVYCVWLGLFNVMEECGLVEKIAKITKPIIKMLYGKIDDVAASYIAMNMSANLIGVSNASTPSAVKAIGIMEQDEQLSKAGTMLFVINATSIQIIPSTVMGLRAQMGSANPSDIMLPTLISTAFTTVLGVVLVKLLYKIKEKKQNKKPIPLPIKN